ncbi:MAG: TolC family protein [Acidobacteriota bacterium]
MSLVFEDMREREAGPGRAPTGWFLPKVCWLLVCLGVAIAAGGASAQEADPEAPLPKVRIGLVSDGPSVVLEGFSDNLRNEIQTLTEGEFDVEFGAPGGPEVEVGEWTAESVESRVDALLENPEIDLLISLGVLSSHGFCCREELPKPVIASVIVDIELQNLPLTLAGTSGRDNLNYVAFPDSVVSDLEEFHRVVPFEHLTVIFNRWFVDLVPGLSIAFAESIAEAGFRSSLVEVGDSVAEALAEVPEETDVVYVAPVLHLGEQGRRDLYSGLTERGLPSFALLGVEEVPYGAMAAQREATVFRRLARRVALNAQSILLGTPAGSLPVILPDQRLLTLNMDVVRQLGVYPPWDVLAEAELINEEPTYEREISLLSVLDEAVEANLDLLAGRREVLAGAQEVEKAQAQRKPQLSFSLTGLTLDKDRANPLAGQAERELTAGLTVEQLIYSEPAWANIAIQRALQLQREEAFEQLTLDIQLEAALAYLDLLRAKTSERIRKEDLRLTRSNLESAQVRRSVGTGGPGEVYRWQASLADARRALIDAQELRRQAEEAVNAVLRRDLTEGFSVVEVSLDDPDFLINNKRVAGYTSSALHFAAFSDFQVALGLLRSPEIAQLDAAIAAQERVLESARRAFREPQVALQGTFEERLIKQGEGSDDVPGAPDDTRWSLAVIGSLDLISGGERTAAVVQAQEDLRQLQLQREAAAQGVEQGVRATLHQTRASSAGIRLAKESANAAGRNLELVRDAYLRGAVEILDLLDAQNAALQADLAAGDVIYQFFIDLLEHQRTVGGFDFFDPQAESEWLERLDAHFDRVGVDPTPPEAWWRVEEEL